MPSRLALASSLIALIAAAPAVAEQNFNRIASFATPLNNAERAADPSSAEIIAASEDGMTLVYTD
ncbi:MAG: hypothetical protein RL123_1719, partial [Pseudomonadota bacterium]